MDSMEMRRDAIVQLINEMGTVSFAQIKKEFPNVSEMTLRTDLKILDEEKKILRVHGGAKSVQVIIGTDDFLNRKSVRNIAEKQEIAKKAYIFSGFGKHDYRICTAYPGPFLSDLYYRTELCD